MNTKTFSIFLIFILGGLGYGIYFLSQNSNSEVLAAVITAASTVIVSSVAIAFGRYLEKQKELEALHREQKIPIYGKLLTELLEIFYETKGKKLNIVKFLQEWQQKIILWGGPAVVNAYIAWKHELTTHTPDVNTIESTEKLIYAIREELGHDDKNMVDGVFPHFILREAELYLKHSKINPNLTLDDFGIIENDYNVVKAEEANKALNTDSAKNAAPVS